MAKVLLAWELGGGLGHCAKLAPVARGLVERGYEVYFAARDVATAERLVGEPSVKFLPSPGLASRPARSEHRPRTFAQVLAQVGFGDDAQLRSLVVAWRNLIELVSPAALICEHAPSALIASHWFKLPTAVMGTGFSLPPDVSPLPDLCPWLGPSAISFAAQENSLLDRVNRILAADRHPTLQRLAQIYSDADEQFLMTFSELDHHPNRGNGTYYGSWSIAGGDKPVWPEGDGPGVFAYLKPPPGNARLEPTLALLRELPIRTLAYVPRPAKSVLGLASKSLSIVSKPLDMGAVVKECSLAILNGTAGTTTQCLLGGVPVLLLPHYLEQAALSRRVVDLGAGEMAPPNRVELQAARLWKLLHNDSYRIAAEAFAKRYAKFDAQEQQLQVIDRLEKMIHSSAKPRGVNLNGSLSRAVVGAS